MMALYHRTQTQSAEAILRDGFKDATATYGVGRVYTGVWLSDVPLGAGDIAYLGPALLRVTLRLAETDIEQFEWIEESKTYREWLIPAQTINDNSTIEMLTEADEDAIFDEMWAKRLARAKL